MKLILRIYLNMTKIGFKPILHPYAQANIQKFKFTQKSDFVKWYFSVLYLKIFSVLYTRTPMKMSSNPYVQIFSY